MIECYERVVLTARKGGTTRFLYAAYLDGSNNIQVGFGVESASGLNRQHIGTIFVHELHVLDLVDHIERLRPEAIQLVPGYPPSRVAHDRSSTGQTCAEYRTLLKGLVDKLVIYTGDHEMADTVVTPEMVSELSRALRDVALNGFNIAKEHDILRYDLLDGRFVWALFDEEYDAIRVGMGYYDADNDPHYGGTTYALTPEKLHRFAHSIRSGEMAVMPFAGLPYGWPREMSIAVRTDDCPAVVDWLESQGREHWPFKMEMMTHFDL